MPKYPAIILALGLGLTVALTACSGSAGTSAGSATDAATDSAETALSPEPCTTPGTGSDAVTVSGEFGAAPTVTFTTPLAVADTERTVAAAGSGATVATAGSQVSVSYTAYNASTGDQIDTTGYGADGANATLAVDNTKYISGLVKAINCSVDGDRVVAVIPAADGFGDTGSSDFGITADDAMVFVIDVNTVVPSRATGVAQEPVAGLPTVTLADDGKPTVSIPDADAPAELTVSVLQKGAGAAVTDGDTVTLEYTGVNWDTGKTFDSSWTTSGPTSFATTAVVEGFGTALVGQTVGSQVLAVIPPALGYGTAGNDSAGISGTDTLVFVVDILATAPTPAA